MANSGSALVKFHNFAQLSGRYQRAVVLKSQGVTHQGIAETLEGEFGVSCARNTVNQWFIAGGMLENALYEYNDTIATYSIKRAEQLLKRATLPAVITLAGLLNDPNPSIQLRAAIAIINKYIPDAKFVREGDPFDYGIPPELSPEAIEIADRIVMEPDTG